MRAGAGRDWENSHRRDAQIENIMWLVTETGMSLEKALEHEGWTEARWEAFMRLGQGTKNPRLLRARDSFRSSVVLVEADVLVADRDEPDLEDDDLVGLLGADDAVLALSGAEFLGDLEDFHLTSPCARGRGPHAS